TLPEGPTVPEFQVIMVPFCWQLFEHDTNVVPAGTVSVMTTFVATALPELEYASVYVICPPGVIWVLSADFARTRFGAAFTHSVLEVPVPLERVTLLTTGN